MGSHSSFSDTMYLFGLAVAFFDVATFAVSLFDATPQWGR